MTPEILLKAYVQYQSEDAFRELVARTLDGVYSTSLRIVQGTQHLAEEIAVRVYLELARKARRLAKDVVVASWLRERACKMAVTVLHAEDRPVDRAALKKEREALSNPVRVDPAPAGLAIRICYNVFMNTARDNGLGLYLPRLSWPAWIRPRHIGGVAVCVFAVIVWRNHPFHHRNPIIKSQGVLLTPSSFAQRGRPQDGGPATQGQTASTNGGMNSKPK